jgi:excisionase family DNA binding protein
VTTPLLVNSSEAATILSVSEKVVRDLANDGVLEKRYIGSRNYRITYASLERYVDSLSQDPVAS